MPMNLTTVKNTGQETIIHFEATDASFATIALSSLTSQTQARNANAPKVNIVRFITTGEDGALLIVSRGTKQIIACSPENAPFLDMTSMGITESILNDQDIKIENKLAKAVSGYITLRKVAGWSGTIEIAEFGSYDNPLVVGS